MNKRGEVNLSVGLVVMALVAIVVGVALFTATAANVGTATSEGSTANLSVTLGNAGTFVDITGQELLSTPVIYNRSGPITLVSNDNFTIAEGVSTVSGVKRIRITPVGLSSYNSSVINLSYTYGPEGYIDNSGGRSITSLILVFFALGIAVIALIPALRNGVMDLVGK